MRRELPRLARTTLPRGGGNRKSHLRRRCARSSRATATGSRKRAMQLSAELYSQIIKDLVSDGLGEFGRQQRREPRVGVRAKAYILPSLSSTTPIPVRVRDVSVGGMGLLLPREIGADRLFLLLLPKVGG